MKYENSKVGYSIYSAWNSMVRRCTNPKDHKYYRYGARGIIVCDEWKDNYENFYNWSIQNGYKLGLSLDRINNDGNYEPNNCRWTTRKVQQRNMCRNKLITYKNQTHCLSEWCELLGLPYNPILKRLLYQGYSVEKAFETPINKKKS